MIEYIPLFQWRRELVSQGTSTGPLVISAQDVDVMPHVTLRAEHEDYALLCTHSDKSGSFPFAAVSAMGGE